LIHLQPLIRDQLDECTSRNFEANQVDHKGPRLTLWNGGFAELKLT